MEEGSDHLALLYGEIFQLCVYYCEYIMRINRLCVCVYANIVRLTIFVMATLSLF